MKTGIMGGTFDPIHTGHLIIAEAAFEEFGLDRILFMPAGNPPHKQARAGRASNEERMEMTAVAISGNPHFVLSDHEMKKQSKSYSCETLAELHELYPEDELYFIIGGDSLRDFMTWHKPEVILQYAVLLAAGRDEVSNEALREKADEICRNLGGRIEVLSTPSINISSSRIREMQKNGRSIRYLVPESVRTYINERGIYGRDTL